MKIFKTFFEPKDMIISNKKANETLQMLINLQTKPQEQIQNYFKHFTFKEFDLLFDIFTNKRYKGFKRIINKLARMNGEKYSKIRKIILSLNKIKHKIKQVTHLLYCIGIQLQTNEKYTIISNFLFKKYFL